MTYYNSRIYTITEIHFNMTPRNEFTLQNGKKISYLKYLEENYKIKLQYPDDQPMIRCHLERTNQDVYLVPETCVVTGITDEQKGKNFRAIKDEMFANAQKKAEQAQLFFQAIKRDKTKYKQFVDKFKIEVMETPMIAPGYPCKPASVVADLKQKDFALRDLTRDFSHEFTAPLSSPALSSWGIFYSSYGKRELDQFVKEV